MATSGSSRIVAADALKAKIFEAISIAEVAEDLGADLSPNGSQYATLCLLHTESTPSMMVAPDKGPGGSFFCHGCKASGDVVSLVQQKLHLGFIDALLWLAEFAEVDVEEFSRPMTDNEIAERELRDWCERWLAAPLLSPPSRIDPDEGVRFGATTNRQAGRDVPPYFSNGKGYLLDGTILPWRSPSGRLLGWRVREHDGKPKHVSSTGNEFPLGRIHDTLFGIQVAREHIVDGRLIACEGEFDVMAMHAAGIRNVVGLGGSSLSPSQLALLKEIHVREVVVLLDSDADRAASALAEKHWSERDVLVRVVRCVEGLDPEEMLARYGDWAVLQLINSAPSALEYLLRQEWAKRGRTTLSDKLEFVGWVRESYGSKLDHIQDALVLHEVAKWLEIPEVEARDFLAAADQSGELCALDSERVLLGRACQDRDFLLDLRGRLEREDFFLRKHQRLWDVLAEMISDGHSFDPITVAAKAQRHGLPEGFVADLWEMPDSNLDFHRDRVADLALRRSTRDDVALFRDRIGDLSREAEEMVGELTHAVTSRALRKTGAEQQQISEQVDEAMDLLHTRMENPTEIWGLDLGTQLPRLSRTLQGLQPGRLYLVAAISRIGKSTMLTQWAAVLGIHQSLPVDFVSLEMDQTEILYKLCSHMTAIDSTKISGGRLDPAEAKAVEYAMQRIRNSPLRIWCPDGMTATEFLLYARESHMRRHTQAFFVDYVQLIDPGAGQERDNGYKLYGDFARMVKMKVAKALPVAVVCAAQLNREAATKERPTSESMGDSYALVRHSNVVIILHGNEDSSTLDLLVDKNRGGAGGGLVPLIYDRPTQTFREAGEGLRHPEYLIRA